MKRTELVRISILLVIAVVVGSACWPFDDEELSEMSLERLSGRVEVVRGGDVLDVESSIDLQPGDIVQTGRASSAALRLKGERKAWMLASAETAIVDTRTLESQRGALLADAGEHMRIRFGDVEAASSNGLFRVDQRFASARAASYRGSVDLSAPGQGEMRVSSLYQASISANDLPPSSNPYDLEVGDTWDAEYLGALVELEDQLNNYAGGLASQLGRQRPKLSYFREFADGADVSFMRPYLKRSTPNLLIGFSVADNAEDLSLGAAFRRAFRIYDDFENEAHWSIVAGILDVLPKPLLAQVESIITATEVVTAAGTGGNPAEAFTLAAARQAEAGAGPGGQPPDDNPKEPKEKPDPKESESPPPGDECTSTIDCAVDDLTDPSPSPSPTDPPD